MQSCTTKMLLLLTALVAASAAHELCAGDEAMDAPMCFAGSKMGVTLTARYSPDAVSLAVSWGDSRASCNDVPVSSTGLDAHALGGCLPSEVMIEDVQYCSKDGKIALRMASFPDVSVYLSKVDCNDGSDDLVLADRAGPLVLAASSTPVAAQGYPSNNCPGSDAFPADQVRCYSATRLGVTFSGRVLMHSDLVGEVNFTVAGLIDLNCLDVPLSQHGQLIDVNQTALSSCLPDYVSIGSVSYCSDLDDLVVTFIKPLPFLVHLSTVTCQPAEENEPEEEEKGPGGESRRLRGAILL